VQQNGVWIGERVGSASTVPRCSVMRMCAVRCALCRTRIATADRRWRADARAGAALQVRIEAAAAGVCG